MMDEKQYEAYCNFINDLLYEIMTLDDYERVMSALGVSSPKKDSKWWMYPSICHNLNVYDAKYNLGFSFEDRHYYCFSECNINYSLLTLVEKRFKLIGETKTKFQCIRWICDICKIPFDINDLEPVKQIEYNWRKSLGKYVGKKSRDETDLKVYDESVLDKFDKLYHESFIKDNISIEAMERFNIRYYKYGQQICIPVYSDNGDFIGIHARNLKEEMIDIGFKYIPLKINGTDEYKFPTSCVLYGLYQNLNTIVKKKSAILVEAPKSVLQADSILGKENNIVVGMFGMSLKKQQRNLLLKYDINTLYIGLDKQYKSMYDENGNMTVEFENYQKKIDNIYKQLRAFIPNIYVIYDKDEGLLEYKMSPFDNGKEIWEKLFERKVML